MEQTVVNRVNYFPRQILRTQDFVDEQGYHLQTRRRHNIAHHIWGIVIGLELMEDKKNGTIVVTPGFAVDGFGRELVLPTSWTIGSSAFDEKLAEALDVWAVYSRTAGDRGDPLYQPCDPEDVRSPYRWAEVAHVEWSRAIEPMRFDPTLGVPQRRDPPDLSTQDLAFDATRSAPDDPAARWPVFLGRVERRVSGSDVTYTIDLTGRPYAGARAEAIVAPAGDAWLQIGSSGDASQYRFALFLSTQQQQQQRLVRPTPLLALDSQQQWSIRGDTTIYGDVRVDGGAVEFGKGLVPDVEKPWRIYRVAAPAPELGTSAVVDELRIEIPAGGTPTPHELAIGVHADGEFKKALTIRDDGTVTVDGDLIVEGRVQAQAQIASGLSEQAKALATSVFVSQLMQSFPPVGAGPPDVRFLAQVLKANPEAVIDAVAEHVKQNPELRDRLMSGVGQVEAAPKPPSRGRAKSVPEPESAEPQEGKPPKKSGPKE